MFTQEEKEVLFRILGDVKVNPLDSNTIPLVTIIQSIAKKAFKAEAPAGDEFDDLPKGKAKKQA